MYSLIRTPKPRLPGDRIDSPEWVSRGSQSDRFILVKERGIFLLASAAIFNLRSDMIFNCISKFWGCFSEQIHWIEINICFYDLSIDKVWQRWKCYFLWWVFLNELVNWWKIGNCSVRVQCSLYLLLCRRRVPPQHLLISPRGTGNHCV